MPTPEAGGIAASETPRRAAGRHLKPVAAAVVMVAVSAQEKDQEEEVEVVMAVVQAAAALWWTMALPLLVITLPILVMALSILGKMRLSPDLLMVRIMLRPLEVFSRARA